MNRVISKKPDKCDNIYQKYVKVTTEGVIPSSHDDIEEDKGCNSGAQNVKDSDLNDDLL